MSVFDTVARYSELITIVSDNNNACVLLSMEEWSDIQETLYLQSIPAWWKQSKRPLPYKKLRDDLEGCCSRKINEQHRFIYEVLPNTDNIKDEKVVSYKGIVHVLRMWTHYE